MERGVRGKLFFLSILLVTSFLLSLSYGPAGTGLSPLLDLLEGGRYRSVVVEIRLPRALLAILVGMSLSVSGLLMQTGTRNPLADPYLLGVSSGALVASNILVLLLPGSSAFTQWAMLIAGVAGGFSAFMLTTAIAERAGMTPSSLVLAGIAVSSMLSGLTILLSVLVQSRLGTLVLLLLGSFSTATLSQVEVALPVTVIVIAATLHLSKGLDALLLGEEAAVQLGYDPSELRRLAAVIAALGTAVSVGVAGVIGFVGLVVPHMARMIVGARHRDSTIASALLGGSILCASDLAARIAGRSLLLGELPVGAVTALLGAPFFAYLIIRSTGGSRW